jgi:hypothetical protein
MDGWMGGLVDGRTFAADVELGVSHVPDSKVLDGGNRHGFVNAVTVRPVCGGFCWVGGWCGVGGMGE